MIKKKKMQQAKSVCVHSYQAVGCEMKQGVVVVVVQEQALVHRKA